ncbi:MAG: hypothetical protein MJ193_03605, partial [Clostridia bacterium]|nr:hypothetical protein [Clostridia bacterium]
FTFALIVASDAVIVPVRYTMSYLRNAVGLRDRLVDEVGKYDAVKFLFVGHRSAFDDLEFSKQKEYEALFYETLGEEKFFKSKMPYAERISVNYVDRHSRLSLRQKKGGATLLRAVGDLATELSGEHFDVEAI